MNQLLIICLANLLIGCCIGLTGIAGFLLPMLYISFLGLPFDESMLLSFAAFLVSGISGTVFRTGAIARHKPIAAAMSIGSLVGALAAMLTRHLFSARAAVLLMYSMVLLSGLLALVPRKECEGKQPGQSPGLYAAAGLAIGFVCALSGAGGPVLIIPVLLMSGLDVNASVGIGLLASIAIAVPSIGGYWRGVESVDLLPLLLTALCAHAAGIALGNRWSLRVPAAALKLIIAVGSVAVAAWKLYGML